ncbi:hypothetical protein PoB_003662100 [Plakobranchus ocellatus]|uniref:Uncharacterized protein n=1 Tax=Plakobranchus ocellatus TaxID=259542 RepID=A0AAV4APM5_9GAST|nr:hypothetical protein PoB_003662100 [Plakobranchus ocellatus]
MNILMKAPFLGILGMDPESIPSVIGDRPRNSSQSEWARIVPRDPDVNLSYFAQIRPTACEILLHILSITFMVL